MDANTARQLHTIAPRSRGVAAFVLATLEDFTRAKGGRGRVRIKDLSNATGYTASTVHRALRHLAHAGLISAASWRNLRKSVSSPTHSMERPLKVCHTPSSRGAGGTSMGTA